MVLVELLTLAPPYNGLPKDVAISYLKSGTIPSFPNEKDFGFSENQIVAIIQNCLQMEPEKRPSADQLIISFCRLSCV
jgi:hypothetical protein